MAGGEDTTYPGDGGVALRGYFARPSEGDGPWPGVIVIHEIFGLNDDIRRIASRFADNGYAAFAPDLWSRGPKLACVMRAMRELRARSGRNFRDIEAARTWLAARPECDGERIGVVGFCMGGGFALLYAVTAPVRATAPFYGDVPKRPEDLAGVCPVVGSYGGRDRMFAGAGRRLAAHLERLGVPNDVRVYETAGHSFMSLHEPPSVLRLVSFPMQPGYNESAAEDAWSRVLTFFAEHVATEEDRG